MATPPPGSIPLPGGGWITPEQQAVAGPKQPMTFEQWQQTPEYKNGLKNVPAHMRREIEAKLKEQFLRQYNVAKTQAQEALVAPAVQAAKIDPSELAGYEEGEEVNYDEAIGALYDPSQVKRDTTGRDYQTGALDYLGGVMTSGRDAASDAYYEGQRADAEQAARAQREAGMQNLEEQGRASGGGALLNELMAARDVGANANRSALESAAMMQARKDNAAQQVGTLGGNVQGADDDWMSWYTGKQTDYGHDVSGIKQNEEASNVERGWSTSDKNTGLYNTTLSYNKQLPLTAYEMYRGAGADVRGETGNYADYLTGERRYQESKPGVIDYAAAALDTGAKVKTLGWGDDDDDEDED